MWNTFPCPVNTNVNKAWNTPPVKQTQVTVSANKIYMCIHRQVVTSLWQHSGTISMTEVYNKVHSSTAQPIGNAFPYRRNTHIQLNKALNKHAHIQTHFSAFCNWNNDRYFVLFSKIFIGCGRRLPNWISMPQVT